jgi:Ca-activated chloride channel family protein
MSLGTREYLLFMLPALMAGLLVIWWVLWRIDARARLGGRVPLRALTMLAPVILVLAACVAALAAARPQIGEHTTAVERRGIDMVIVLDISQSMAATDAEPTRLGRAQAEIAALLDSMQGDRVGLVMFAGEPFVRSPLTSDLSALRVLALGVDRERGLVEAGSDLGAAIRRGDELLESGIADTKAMLIVSDGEDHGGLVDAAIQSVAGQGVRVYTAGAGTAAGSPVLDVTDAGDIVPRTGEDGTPVLTRLDAESLRAMAAAGNGRYIELTGTGQPLVALADELAALDATTFEREETSEPIERFQLFAAAALVLALVGTLLGTGFPRAAALRVRRLLPVAGAGLLIGAICSTDAAEWNRRGNREYAAGDYSRALESSERAQQLSPEERALYYNRANAYAQLGEYVAAIEEGRRSLPTDDGELEALVEYALGSHYANADQLQQALDAIKRALFADPDDEDAKHNYEIVARRLTPNDPEPTPTQQQPESSPPPDDGADGGGTPEPGGAETPGAGTPSAGGSPQPGQPLSEEQLQRLLEEALAGIDEEFTIEEALQVLELIEEQNRGELEEPPTGGAGGPPDY